MPSVVRILYRKTTDLIYTNCRTQTRPLAMNRTSTHRTERRKVGRQAQRLIRTRALPHRTTVFSVNALLIAVSHVIKPVRHSTFCSGVSLQYF